ncbi:hypothetical protein [Methylomonas methanica]|uniref:hypothetical protein n=1 Tax=Methylomonas methanica TaxID=421 RepID=UPI0011D25F7B|nr:hypothetical protein [Methylomonas methanica]
MLSKTTLLHSIIRFAIVWTSLAILIFVSKRQYIDLFLPYLTFVIHLIQEDYKATLSLAGNKGELIQLTAVLNHSVARLQQNTVMSTFIDSLHFIMAQALLFSILFSWPVKRFRSRLKLLLLGVPLALILAGLTTPMLLAGLNETAFQHMDNAYFESSQHSWLLSWMWLVENAGNWFQNVVLALLGGAILQRIQASNRTRG